jgi:hypothetical protein
MRNRVRRRACRRRMKRLRPRGHRALRIQQMILIWSQAQADQSASIRNRLRLPAMIRLIFPHCVFAGLIPGSGRFAAQIVLANQSFLDRLRSLRLNLLLTLCLRGLLTSFARTHARGPATASRNCSVRFRMMTCRGMRRRVRFVGTRALSCRTACGRGSCVWLRTSGLCSTSFRRRRSGRRSGFLRFGKAGQHAGAQQRRSAADRQAPASSYRPTLLFQRQGPLKPVIATVRKNKPNETSIVIIPY